MQTVCPQCSERYAAGHKFCDIDGAKLVPLDDTRPQIQSGEFKTLLHPSEPSRYILALFICIPATIAAVLLVFATYGILLAYLLLMAFFLWFGLSILKASLMANSVRVSDKNFPEIHQVATEVKFMLRYRKRIDIYIIEGGSVNAFIAKFFRTKFIILNSELVTDMIDDEKLTQLKWVIARFIGALQAKHFRLDFLRIIIDSIEKIKVFNLFILPYVRATQYSGDQIGLAVSNDLNQSVIAFDKFMVGNDLAHRVQVGGLVDQALDMRHSFFAWFARLFSTHPHTISRFLNLLAFARWRYPKMFQTYIAQFDGAVAAEIESILPHYSDAPSHEAQAPVEANYEVS